MRKEKPGWAVNLDKELTAIIADLPPEFPRYFSIEDQGRFSIGYYHQKNKHFTKSEEEPSAKEKEVTSENPTT